MIISHHKVIPSYGMVEGNRPVIIYTMLSINDHHLANDCAAYECVGPDMSSDIRFNDNQRKMMIEKMKGCGNKIPEAKAHKLFPQIKEMKLRYRK